MDAIKDRLAKRMEAVLKAYEIKVAVAESCTGGGIAKMLTEYEGASFFFEGGVVAYTPEIKNKLLGVPMALIEEAGVVSQEVAQAMAKGIYERMGVNYGLGVTGIAGPGGATRKHQVGVIFISIYNGERYYDKKLELSTADFIMPRSSNREIATRNGVAMICDMVEEDYGKVEGYQDDYI